MPYKFEPTVHSRRFVFMGLLAFGCFGCGADQYQLRLKESAAYYKYLDNIEQNVAPKWFNGIVESLRVPKQFVQIPAPVPVKKEDGTEELPAVDPRQPDFMNLVFPTAGLMGAWEAPFTVPLADGSTEVCKGYIYVLSNYWSFPGDDALKFGDQMVQLVGDALEDPIPNDKLENPIIESHPKKGTYIPEATYSVFEFHPKAITLKTAEREAKVNYTFTMYRKMNNGDIQGIILLAIPESVSSQEKIPERTAMMLDHFQITRTPPKDKGASGPATTAPAAGF